MVILHDEEAVPVALRQGSLAVQLENNHPRRAVSSSHRMFMESTEEGALHHAPRQSNSKTFQVWLQKATYLSEKLQ